MIAGRPRTHVPVACAMTSRVRLVVAAVAALAWPSLAAAVVLPSGFQDQVFAANLSCPVDLAFLPDGRILFIELKSARLRMLVGGSIASTDPLGTIDSVVTADPEQGLLSIAVDPRWPASPFVYVLSTATDSTIRLSRLTLQGDLTNGASGTLAVAPGSRRELLRDIVSVHTNHNGGSLRFGPDSLLWASFGEDAIDCNATDTTALYGVLARMDVRAVPAGPGPPDKALLVPPSNPYASRPDPDQRLMYARGFRNPFRFTIDWPSGRIFLGDEGLQQRDEVDLIDAPGLWFGWPFWEGTLTHSPGPCVPPAQPMRPPIVEDDHAFVCGSPVPPNCLTAVIGGPIIRTSPATSVSFPPEYDGQYFYIDYYGSRLWRLRDSLGTWVRPPAVPGQPNAIDWSTFYFGISSLVLGPEGALYYCANGGLNNASGSIGRIVHPNPLSVDTPAAVAEFVAAFPSPTRGGVALRFVLVSPARVRIDVYDAAGRLVRRLASEAQRSAGEHVVPWDGRDESGRAATPGIYLARIVADGVARERRIAIVR